MADRSQLDCETHDLLEEANVRLLVGVVDVAGTKAFIIRLRDCAGRATKANFSESANRLVQASDALELRLQNRPHRSP